MGNCCGSPRDSRRDRREGSTDFFEPSARDATAVGESNSIASATTLTETSETGPSADANGENYEHFMRSRRIHRPLPNESGEQSMSQLPSTPTSSVERSSPQPAVASAALDAIHGGVVRATAAPVREEQAPLNLRDHLSDGRGSEHLSSLAVKMSVSFASASGNATRNPLITERTESPEDSGDRSMLLAGTTRLTADEKHAAMCAWIDNTPTGIIDDPDLEGTIRELEATSRSHSGDTQPTSVTAPNSRSRGLSQIEMDLGGTTL